MPASRSGALCHWATCMQQSLEKRLSAEHRNHAAHKQGRPNKSYCFEGPHAAFGQDRQPQREHHIRRPTVHISFASRVTSELRTLETGQFFSASPAIPAKAASSRFGTLARRVSADRLMRKPWPSGSRVTAASVLSSVGV